MAKLTPAQQAARAEFKRALRRVERSYDIYLASLTKTRDARKQGHFWRQHMRCCNDATDLASAARVNVTARTWGDWRNNAQKALTVEQRTSLAPVLKAGLSGRARDLWIDTGMNLTEQMEADRLAGRQTDFAKKPRQRVDIDVALPDAPTAVKRFSAQAVAAKLNLSPGTVRGVGRRLGYTARDGYTLEQAKAIARKIKQVRRGN